MAKKSKKMAATYGKKSTAPKRKRPVIQSEEINGVTSVSASDTPVASPGPQVRAIPRPEVSTRVSSHSYVMSDIKKVAAIGVVLFAALVVLSFVL